MLKRILLSAAALAVLAVPAAAADLSIRAPVKAVVPAPVFSWTGFYIGANAGLGTGDIHTDQNEAGFPMSSSLTASGAFVGGQIGYNYQFANNVVLGIETDLQWSNIEGKWNSVSPLMQMGMLFENKVSIDYFGTIRARLGYAFDRVLPYITGGAAYGRLHADQLSMAETLAVQDGVPLSTSTTNWGWTLGAGVEYAMTNNWTLKVEYLYVDLGDLDRSFTWYESNFAGSTHFDIHTLKAGVNYKF